MDDCGWSWTNGGKVAMGVFVIAKLGLAFGVDGGVVHMWYRVILLRIG